MSRYQKKHSPTHTHRGHQSSLCAFSIYCDPWHPPYSIHMLYSLFPQSLSKFSLVYLLAWRLPLHTPYISSPNHCLLFTAHAHTIATCSAVVLRFCPLIPVSLSTLYLKLCLVTSHHTSILPFSSLPSEVTAMINQCTVLHNSSLNNSVKANSSHARTHTQTHTHRQPFYGSLGFCLGLPG